MEDELPETIEALRQGVTSRKGRPRHWHSRDGLLREARKRVDSAPVLAELIAECERVDPCETGGVLLGYWGDGTHEPVSLTLSDLGLMQFSKESGFGQTNLVN